jgi:hypothetical protein
MKRLGFLVLAIVLALSASLMAQSAVVPKTNPMKVYAHYMPWFETPATLGGNNWGYHWTFNNRNPNIIDPNGQRQIASHYYPLIGPYASSDADVIEYHLLLMKLSGIDGVMIDWYGAQGTNGDVGSLLNNSNAVVNKVDDFGLKFGVVMEDRFSTVSSSNTTPDINKGKANMAYLRDHYFNNSSYIRQPSGKPLVDVFGPITFQTPSQWTTILGQAGENVDLNTLWYENGDAGANATGEYAWIYQDQTNHLTHQANFLNLRAPTLGTAGGVAYPGFNDYYQEGGVGPGPGFEIPHNNGQTLDAVLNQLQSVVNANPGRIDYVQLATFNDFGEGTMFEPTVETGFSYLQRVQQFTGVSYGLPELQLVYDLYSARKQFAGNASKQALLSEVSNKINQLDFFGARTSLNGISLPHWTLVTGGNWQTVGNWNASPPNSVGAAAFFGSAIAGARTVYTNVPVTLGAVTFDNANTYVLAGSGPLTLQVASGSAAINVLQGTHKINLPLTFASDTTITVENGATLKISDPVTVNAGKTVTKDGQGTVVYESTVTILSGGSLQMMAGGSATAQQIAAVSLAGNATLDLNDNSLVTSTSRETIEALVQRARNNGAWDKPGITSTTARNDAANNMNLGVISGAEYTSVGGTGTFAGRPYADSDTLVKYTSNGDTNLSGSITADDYLRTDIGLDTRRTGWVNGDFNYSGSVDFQDYVLIDIAYNLQNGTLESAADYLRRSGDPASDLPPFDPAVRKVVEHFSEFGASYSTTFLSALPEPAAVGPLVVAAAGMLITRPRKRDRR